MLAVVYCCWLKEEEQKIPPSLYEASLPPVANLIHYSLLLTLTKQIR